MGLLDWVTLGRINHNGAGAGEFNLTIGTSYDGTLGGSYSHVLGGDVCLTCDPVEMLLSPIFAGGTSVLGGITLGLGGKNDATYGSKTDMLYGGPKFDIYRARDVQKHSDWFIRPKFRSASVPAPDPLEPTTTASVLALSVLINAVPAAMELAMYFHYKGYYENKDDEQIQHTPEVLKFLAYGLTSRLIAILRALELAATEVQIGTKLLAELTELLRSIAGGISATWHYLKNIRKDAAVADIMSEDVEEEMNRVLAEIRAEGGSR